METTQKQDPKALPETIHKEVNNLVHRITRSVLFAAAKEIEEKEKSGDEKAAKEALEYYFDQAHEEARTGILQLGYKMAEALNDKPAVEQSEIEVPSKLLKLTEDLAYVQSIINIVEQAIDKAVLTANKIRYRRQHPKTAETIITAWAEDDMALRMGYDMEYHPMTVTAVNAITEVMADFITENVDK